MTSSGMLRRVARVRTTVAGPLGPQYFDSPYVSMSNLPIDENYVRFEVFTAVTMKNDLFWNVTLCGSCRATRHKISNNAIIHSHRRENLKSYISD
jgi:hypothetical protein